MDKLVDEIIILCKVVDNYGDAGVVYRLARCLKEISPNTNIIIIVDDYKSFLQLAPDAEKLNIFFWENCPDRIEYFTNHPPKVIIECFACGRPDWFENIVFADNAPQSLIINLEYLTAEDYAEDFHCLMSLTRSANVHKYNFLPGFTDKTGGLLLDNAFMSSLDNSKQNRASPDKLLIPVFSYERNFDNEVLALQNFNNSSNKKVCIQLTEGKAREPFLASWEKFGCPFDVQFIPFVEQTEWDKYLCNAWFSFVRGEDSLSRACLAGVPFVWHAYPQSENYHLVKVKALLNCMRPFFKPELFVFVENYWIDYNTPETQTEQNRKENLDKIFENYVEISQSFAKFALNLQKNGNLAKKLLTFITKML